MVIGVLASHVDVVLCFQLCFDDGVFSQGRGEYLVDGGFDPGGFEALCGIDEDEEEFVEESIEGLQTVWGDDIGRCVCQNGICKLLGDIAHLCNGSRQEARRRKRCRSNSG